MKLSRLIAPLTVLVLITSSCSWYDNRITYFNTYYNIQRIMGEMKDEFEYQDENKRTKPRVLVPGLDSAKLIARENKIYQPQYQFLLAFTIERAKYQPVATKGDSVLLKGSKILANHPKSEYIEGTLFSMAETYFFRQAGSQVSRNASNSLNRLLMAITVRTPTSCYRRTICYRRKYRLVNRCCPEPLILHGTRTGTTS